MRLVIAGDFSPTENTIPLFENGEINRLFGNVTDVFQRADRVVINLECALTTTDNAIRKFGPNLKVTPACAGVLKRIGVTDCAMSNNHIFDYGITGLRDTICNLESNGIAWTGVGYNDI